MVFLGYETADIKVRFETTFKEDKKTSKVDLMIEVEFSE